YYDKGSKGALIVAKSDTRHSNGKKLFTSIITILGRLDGGFGGEDAPSQAFVFPDRKPDFEVDALPSPDQPLIYRLSGDIFQLHVDPQFARMAGFEKPIMHGLCTYGFACRALMKSLIPNVPEKVRRIACRFSQALYPGEPIRTLIWKTQEGKSLWKTINAKSGEVVIDRGIFEYGDPHPVDIRFDGRVAIVTGAGGGLGREYALELARRGARVLVNDYGGFRDGSGGGSREMADRVVGEIRAMGGEAAASYDSVSTLEGGRNIVKAAIDAFGRVDILINNAGILRDRSFGKMEFEDWEGVIGVHLHGAFNVTQPAFRVMRELGYGRILFTISAAGLYGNFGQVNYSAAKMGLVGMMNALKLEGEKYNIMVNAVAPIAATRLTSDILPPDMQDKMKPEYVSPIVVFLCSDECRNSGNIYNAGMGFYNRVALMTGPGAVIGGKENTPSAENVSMNIDKILNIADAKEYKNLTDMATDFMSAYQQKPDRKDVLTDKGLKNARAVF
ncbi:MAG TPA: SDR family NAD(P)-dependent oxidoreductase, partial [Candidatus Limnocylindrales bacterium]|nr:SDR family NAD(P)-dependent oxidoreductase [Candidatus Limnocylindrales bacterium]